MENRLKKLLNKKLKRLLWIWTWAFDKQHVIKPVWIKTRLHHLQFDYMRVTEKFEVLDLPPNLSHHIQTANLLPVQYLHRHLVLGQLMLANYMRRKKMDSASMENWNWKCLRFEVIMWFYFHKKVLFITQVVVATVLK